MVRIPGCGPDVVWRGLALTCMARTAEYDGVVQYVHGLVWRVSEDQVVVVASFRFCWGCDGVEGGKEGLDP